MKKGEWYYSQERAMKAEAEREQSKKEMQEKGYMFTPSENTLVNFTDQNGVRHLFGGWVSLHAFLHHPEALRRREKLGGHLSPFYYYYRLKYSV